MTNSASISPQTCVIRDGAFIQAQIVLPDTVSAIAIEAERCPVEGVSLTDARFVESGAVAFDAILPFAEQIKAGIMEAIAPDLEVTSFTVIDEGFFAAEVILPTASDRVRLEGAFDVVQGVFVDSATWQRDETSAVDAIAAYHARLIELLGQYAPNHLA